MTTATTAIPARGQLTAKVRRLHVLRRDCGDTPTTPMEAL